MDARRFEDARGLAHLTLKEGIGLYRQEIGSTGRESRTARRPDLRDARHNDGQRQLPGGAANARRCLEMSVPVRPGSAMRAVLT
jgi:hypothetical protein